MTMSAKDAANRAEERAGRTEGPDERFDGYGVMGLPFAGGHLLAFRAFPSTPFVTGYRSVWHRDPGGTWTMFVTAPAAESCPRYFDAALVASVAAPVAITWSGPSRVTVEIDGLLTWTMTLATTAATALMSGAGGAMPSAAWRSRAVLAGMGRLAGPTLGVGRIRLAGRVPNGQRFLAAPRSVWRVAASAARLDGVDLGKPGPLTRQAHLADFQLPQRGLFMAGGAVFDALDPARHIAARPALAGLQREAVA
jgi:hypothetical protein